MSASTRVSAWRDGVVRVDRACTYGYKKKRCNNRLFRKRVNRMDNVLPNKGIYVNILWIFPIRFKIMRMIVG